MLLSWESVKRGSTLVQLNWASPIPGLFPRTEARRPVVYPSIFGLSHDRGTGHPGFPVTCTPDRQVRYPIHDIHDHEY